MSPTYAKDTSVAVETSRAEIERTTLQGELTRLGARNIARLLGAVDLVVDGVPSSLAMLQEFMTSATDGWELAKASVRDLNAIEGELKKPDRRHKHLVLLLNKCDLVPTWVTVSPRNTCVRPHIVLAAAAVGA